MEHQHEHQKGDMQHAGHTLPVGKEDMKKSQHIQHEHNPAMGHIGHDHHAMMIDDFKKRFYVVLVLTIPIMLLSAMIQQFIGVDWQFTGFSIYFICIIIGRIFLWWLAFFKRVG